MTFFYIFASFWLIGIVVGLVYMWDEEKSSRKGPSVKKRPQKEATLREVSPDLARLRQLALLGLDESATKDEIKSAYKRLSRIHHPDRFSGMSDSDTEKAADSFRRIREAYEFLT